MDNELKSILYENGSDIVRFVDVSKLPEKQTQGFTTAILFCMLLSKKFITDMYNNLQTECDEYLEKEQKVEELADLIALYIQQKGYLAYAQSEKNNLENGYLESGYFSPEIKSGISILPQKTIARLAGLGFIGKNNLLIMDDYGCAFSMCTVLTNAPIPTKQQPIITSKCGDCNICKNVCPAKAIYGNEWTRSGGRENLVDVSKCFCALKCMVNCPWTLKYAGQIK